MTITIKSLTLKNFLSIGQVSQAVDFDCQDLTLILGENLDLGGDGARNGTGKTTIIQGLSYALFGSAINQIKKDNLINRTNQKNMVATVEFNVRGVDYKIIRGRKPNILKFYVDNQEQQSTDDSQGDSRETQDAIERVLCMSNEMFQHIIGLNSYTTPFLAMKVSDQRTIIEQLLGITLLSERADAIKELNKKTKDDIQQEEYRIKATEEANKRIQEQIDSLKKRSKLWTARHNEELSSMVSEYDELSKVNIEVEIENHKLLGIYNEKQKVLEQRNSLIARQTSWREKIDREVKDLRQNLESLNTIDIVSELESHKLLVLFNEQSRQKLDYDKKLSSVKQDIKKETKNWSKLDTEVTTLKTNRCYACNQEFHDENHSKVLDNKVSALEESRLLLEKLNNELSTLENNPVIVSDEPKVFYKTESEAVRHRSEIDNIQNQIDSKLSEVDPYSEQLEEIPEVELGTKPIIHYDTEEQAIKHSGKILVLLDQIEKKHSDVDPYKDQIVEMETRAIEVVNFDNINELNKILQHQEYLLDLLTNKKSFVRKRIIEQNLSFLNSRLTHYLDKIGLPHQVVFQNDLSVEITELGRDMDFANLSRGEMNRVVLALSFAFRDVWESLYSPVNVVFVDELIDAGMDTIGVENSLALLKDMTRRRNKSVWLVSHKEELVGRVNSVLKVVKESGFTSYSSSREYLD